MSPIPSAMCGNNEARRSVRRTAAPSFGSILGNPSGTGAGVVDPERYESVDGRLVDLLKHAFFDNPTAIES
jgi:hypothetical protein